MKVRVRYMKSIKNILYNKLCNITHKIEKYKSMGYRINYDTNNDQLIINHNNIDYTVKIIEENNNLYWYLEPYNDTYFTTLYENGFDMVLFAIKENENLYREG